MNTLKSLLFLYSIFSSVVFAGQQTLTFGIVPQQATAKLLQNWGPLLSHLSNETGIKLIFKTAKDIPAFEKELAKGTYDLAYMNPYHYIEFHRKQGYQAFAKSANKQVQGIIVVKKGANIKTLNDLNHQTLVFPSPNAFAATLLTQAELKARNINYQSRYVSSHDSVYLNIAKGFAAAGGGINRTFNSLPKALQNQLTILETTQGHTPHAFAYHPRVSTKSVGQILVALRHLHNSEQGKLLLKNLKMSAIEHATNQNWDDIRALNIANHVPTETFNPR